MKGLFNNRGEGYINTGVKIIIAVVIGALILGGIYFLFAGDNGVFAQLNDNVEGLMEYEGNDVVVRIDNDSTYVTDLQYSTDGIRWQNATIPTYAEGAVIEKMVSHEQIHCAVVRDSEGTYIMTSLDNGVTWENRRGWDSKYNLWIGWNESLNQFTGSYESSTMLQELRSSDGITWRNYNTPWVKLLFKKERKLKE